MRLYVRHTTRYDYLHPVVHGLQRLRLRPKSTHGQQVIEWDMRMDGATPEVAYDDEHHNHVSLVTLDAGVTRLEVTCAGIVDTVDNAGVIGQHAGYMPLWCFLRPTDLTRPGPRTRALAGKFPKGSGNTVATLHELSAAVLDAMAYDAGKTDSTTSAEDALAAGHGVCQDHAHVFIAACRLLDMPARYVSGYLMLDDRIRQEAGHAWAEAHVDGLGWVGFDVSNAMCPDERYIRVATGCDYAEAAPVTGFAVGAGHADMHVELAVAQQQIGQ